MNAPDTPKNEAQRMSALRSLLVLDTPAEERFDRITRMARKLLGTEIALVSLIDSDRQWFKSAQGLAAPETGRDISFCGHAILGEDAFVVCDARDDPRFSDNPLVVGDPSIRLYAGQPLHAPDGHRVGTLCVIDREPRSLDSEDLRTLKDLAVTVERELEARALSASEVVLRQELQETKEAARTDPLTRVWNRGAIMRLLDLELRRARQAGEGVGVAMVDLDHFKHINDTFGHPGGDEVLRVASDRMRSSLRQHDSVGRYGGEEFLIVMTDCDRQNSAQVAERVRHSLASSSVELPAGPCPVSTSIGVWQGVPGPDDSPARVIAAADAALYRAKAAGRDRVVVDDGLAACAPPLANAG
jgi:diguanylate cyclase (GGDEF)-like protein